MVRHDGLGAGHCLLVCLIGSLLIVATIGVPVPQDDASNESDLPTSSTTEHPHAAIAKLYEKPTDRPGTLQYSSGTHKFRIAPNEDETKRLLEEYNYHFERVEKGLPPTTQRSARYSPPSKD